MKSRLKLRVALTPHRRKLLGQAQEILSSLEGDGNNQNKSPFAFAFADANGNLKVQLKHKARFGWVLPFSNELELYNKTSRILEELDSIDHDDYDF